jgi:hypothetical protein
MLQLCQSPQHFCRTTLRLSTPDTIQKKRQLLHFLQHPKSHASSAMMMLESNTIANQAGIVIEVQPPITLLILAREKKHMYNEFSGKLNGSKRWEPVN